jgi:hypothetical protein
MRKARPYEAASQILHDVLGFFGWRGKCRRKLRLGHLKPRLAHLKLRPHPLAITAREIFPRSHALSLCSRALLGFIVVSFATITYRVYFADISPISSSAFTRQVPVPPRCDCNEECTSVRFEIEELAAR